jgi:AraC-like DNA-binding protein
VLFGRPEDAALVFAASDLERQVPGADRGLLPIVERHLAASLPPRGEGDAWLEGLRDEISRRICDGQPTIFSLAKRLGLGVRTLQRRLDERGLVFKTLVEEIRRDLALRYLGDEGPSLTEVAFLLGYSEVSAFNRAFRRWTGGTPLSHRKRALAPASAS